MKRAFSLLLPLTLLAGQVIGQKVESNKIDFQYRKLPLTPFEKNIKGYTPEFVIQNEQDLLRKKQESQQEFEKNLAIQKQQNADELAAYEFRRDHYDDFVKQAQAEHNLKLEAYNKSIEKMNMLEKMDYRQKNPPPKFEMPQKAGPTPPRFSYPSYYPPKDLDILEKKDIVRSTYLRIEGYKPTENSGLIVKATLYPFESKAPVTTERKENYYDQTTKAYQYRTISTMSVEGKYPIALQVTDQTNGKVLLDVIIGGDFQTFTNGNPETMASTLLDQNLKQVQGTLNAKYGFATATRNTVLYTVKPKKFEYPEFQSALEKAMSFYNTLKYTDQDLSANIKEACALWEKTLTEYNPNDSKSRIDEDIAKATHYNLAEAYLWLNDFDKANMELTKLFAFKLKDKEKKEIDGYKDFINDQKERYMANK